jgi:hypothetical protein
MDQNLNTKCFIISMYLNWLHLYQKQNIKSLTNNLLFANVLMTYQIRNT